MLIGLLGYAGAGKDTVASILATATHPILGTPMPFERRAFADKLRELALKINPVIDPGTHDYNDDRLSELVERWGWDMTKRTYDEVRTLLQNLGQGAREVLGDTVWIDAVLPRSWRELPALDVAVTDVRYRNEAERIVSLGGRLWVIDSTGRGVGPVNSLASEGFAGWIQDLPYVLIVNDSTLEDLAAAIPEILRYERLRVNAAPFVRYSVAHVAEHLRKEAA